MPERADEAIIGAGATSLVVFGSAGIGSSGVIELSALYGNNTAGDRLAFDPQGNASPDCKWKGVGADATHEVVLFMRGRVFGSETVGGNAFGYQSDLLNVFCHYIDTSQGVHLVLNEAVIIQIINSILLHVWLRKHQLAACSPDLFALVLMSAVSA